MQTDAAQWFANTVAGWALAVGAVSLLTAIAAAIFSRSQAQSARRQAIAAEDTLRLQAEALQSQADDTRRALMLAERSATAAADSAEHARKQLEARRAWITVQDWEFDREAHKNLPEHAWLTLTNSGESPALDVTSFSCFLISHVGFDEDDIQYMDDLNPTMGALGPRTTFRGPTSFFYADMPTVAAFRDRTQVLFWYGRVKFEMCSALAGGRNGVSNTTRKSRDSNRRSFTIQSAKRHIEPKAELFATDEPLTPCPGLCDIHQLFRYRCFFGSNR